MRTIWVWGWTRVSYGTKKYAAKVSAARRSAVRQVTGRLRFSGEVPQGLRQNQRLSTRIVLELRDDVLKVQRGAFLDAAAGESPTSCRTTSPCAGRSAPAPVSVSEVEILEGLALGDRIIISNLGEFERVETVRLAD